MEKRFANQFDGSPMQTTRGSGHVCRADGREVRLPIRLLAPQQVRSQRTARVRQQFSPPEV